jgi:hypothetical protein
VREEEEEQQEREGKRDKDRDIGKDRQTLLDRRFWLWSWSLWQACGRGNRPKTQQYSETQEKENEGERKRIVRRDTSNKQQAKHTGRPVACRASLTAFSTDSAPELAKWN